MIDSRRRPADSGFQKSLTKLGLKQPNNGIAYSVEQAAASVAGELWLPAGQLRPSYCSSAGPRHADHPRRHHAAELSARCRAGPGPGGEIRQKYPADKTGQINTLLSQEPAALRHLSDGSDQRSASTRALATATDVHVSGHHGAHRGKRASISGDSACSLPVHHAVRPKLVARARAPDGGALPGRCMSAG